MRPRDDTIGANDAVHRRPDPHIETQVRVSLGEARTVLNVEPVPIPRDCRDGFLRAYWQRPEAYLDPGAKFMFSLWSRLTSQGLRP